MPYEKYALFRDKRGLTNYAVSKATGIAQSTLSDWKNGLSAPKVDKLVKIARLFGMSLDEMLGDEAED